MKHSPGESPSTMPPRPLFFAALRQNKWMILLFTILGLSVAAALVMSGGGSSFESTAKILIQENVDPDASDREFQAPSKEVLATEVAILTSWDVAQHVVDEVGIDRILPGATKDQAVGIVLQRLECALSTAGGMMRISYRSDDRELTSETLQKFIAAYYEMHLAVHREPVPSSPHSKVQINVVQRPSDPSTIRNFGGPLWLIIVFAVSGPLVGCVLAVLRELRRRSKSEGAPLTPPSIVSPASS